MARQSKTVNINGQDYTLAAVSGSGRFSDKDREEALRQTINNGRVYTIEEFKTNFIPSASTDSSAVKNGYQSYLETLKLNKNSLPFSIDFTNPSNPTVVNDENAQQAAFDSYYNDLFSTKAGTTGGNLYNAYVQQEQNAGRNAMLNANAMGSQLTVQQAAAVKSITDQVRAERMARLRAGMSESQIANQDMQQLMANINALNDQAVAANQAYLQGQQQYNDAQATAYTNWANTLGQLGTAGSAYAAADAGDAYLQTLKRMQATGENYKTANKYVTGQVNNTGGK